MLDIFYKASMSRGGSSGGGQSSLGYLFGPEGGQQPPKEPPPSPSKKINPPYGIDREEDDDGEKKQTHPSSKQEANINNYHRAQGQNSGNFITDRPSTKVKYVPGGNSSLGYLFGDK
ncbi:hypothetical protein RND81_13G034900 [Saponaria officinalis]|uniref:Protein SPIRAL1-like 5 n=2 Tax=Saponaria officinalis TaxID=3572 RepID=A0AAW1GVM5_SAPOF